MFIMAEVKVDLDFACCACGKPMGVTVMCTSQGLAAGARAVTSVAVPCLTCFSVNQLYFEPSGTIHAVAPYQKDPRPVLQPSMN